MKLIDLDVCRTVDATPDEVYDVFTDPAQFGAWFGCERLIMNPVVDGLYYIAMSHQGRLWPHYGRFLVLERPRRFEMTWMSEGTKGNESIVRIALEPRGSGTEIALTHTGVPDDEMGLGHKEGWT